MNSSLDNKVLIECYKKGMTDREIALHVGCPARTVSSRRQSLNLPSLYRKHKRIRVTPERLDLQYANELEKYYDKKAELKDAEYKTRTSMIREEKMRLGNRYNATRDLARIFGHEKPGVISCTKPVDVE